MDEKELLDRGFVEYKKSPIHSECIDHVYQKCYRGPNGEKRYFIDVNHWNFHHPYTHEDWSSYEITTQLYLKGTHNAVNLTFISGDLDEAENLIEKLFENELVEDYEYE